MNKNTLRWGLLFVALVAIPFVSCTKLKALLQKKGTPTAEMAQTGDAGTVAKNELKGTVDGQNTNITFSSVRAYYEDYKGLKVLTVEASDASNELTVFLPLPIKEGDTLSLKRLLPPAEGEPLQLDNATALFGPKGGDPVLNSTGGFVKLNGFEGKVGGKVDIAFKIESPAGVLEGGFNTVQGADVSSGN
ncbi:MAG: hypothetical protein A2W61_00125 [Deltaproteobacteria bacterium RIFCSPLOWO2_01_44_7]|nr:MAG: hypothetical protein A2712_00835 [Deltaproteobacteria bacterium RIFCSPHIGHO2_01_FULL_43_49]OGQ15313.1 MAG: hypothetical protein A3D22_04640 [Deltaproteobacteria bacterium RIFCSPHIGHO2_02_FULL_44_53]OGQ27063.1 MAG: hypothetical protein A3D98_01425 [Deltaproteobacteria bacterium RIFCSPHIGHO2_12_FULL_44_21]OGQ31829.1 MAG: hypothetical protein A2979_05800 [Deltaproteobacteria bacterium RIFCSPLOWO2_01_FULL_45_74]OGQ37643.1 MAG: hypothetical protein A2W61_00125 [Deltaproteobacteria bacterium 